MKQGEKKEIRFSNEWGTSRKELGRKGGGSGRWVKVEG